LVSIVKERKYSLQDVFNNIKMNVWTQPVGKIKKNRKRKTKIRILSRHTISTDPEM
jgi:hypothetical protein